ncbi:c-type cytochrome [Mucilaginibacter defluvii]|uniref:C-type cytochrome n=1 Tax=Mucilaginibacter defluvii TaxID=1196019 RepID=A0ABP9G0Y4_9SPHI
MKTTIYLFVPALVLVVAMLYACGEPAKGNNEQTAVSAYPDSIVKKGEYLVTIMGCNDCHSPKQMGPKGPELVPGRMLSGYRESQPLPDFPADALKKGFVVVGGDMTIAAGPWGISFAANLTPDETGIGNWTEAQFKNALTHGKYKGLDGGRPLMPPMPWQNYTRMRNDDVKAVFAYLKSIPAVKNLVPAYRPAKRS